MVSAGRGQQGFGVDFRLGAAQTTWLIGGLATARASGMPVAVFTPAYPFDRTDKETATDLSGLLWNSGVRLVEMGHTHDNELAPDGRTLYTTARSVGQNEDGPVGYAVVAVDGDVVSWRLRQSQQTWPFVLITRPADRRVATEALAVANGQITVRAVAFSKVGAAACLAECRVDGGAWLPMGRVGDGCTFQLAVDWPIGSREVSVRVIDGRWSGPWDEPDFMDIDTIEPAATDFKSAPAEQARQRRPGVDLLAHQGHPRPPARAEQERPQMVRAARPPVPG